MKKVDTAAYRFTVAYTRAPGTGAIHDYAPTIHTRYTAIQDVGMHQIRRKIYSRYMADAFKQVTIHKKYMVSGGIGPIFGGKVALTRA